MSASRRVHAVEYLPISCHQCPHAQREPQLAPASIGDLLRPAGRSGPRSYEVTAFALCPSVQRTPVCALQDWGLYFPLSCVFPAIKPCWLPKPNSLGAPLPYSGPPGRGACLGVQNSLLREKSNDIIILQLGGNPPGRYGI